MASVATMAVMSAASAGAAGAGAIASTAATGVGAIGPALAGTASASQLSALALTTGAVGIGMGVTSAVQQGRVESGMHRYNARVLAARAEAAKRQSLYEARETREEARQLRARQLVSFAGGGVVPSVGTPLRIQKKTAAVGEQQAQFIEAGGDIARLQLLSGAGMEKYMAKSRTRAGLWKAGTTLTTGASDILWSASAYKRLKTRRKGSYISRFRSGYGGGYGGGYGRHFSGTYY